MDIKLTIKEINEKVEQFKIEISNKVGEIPDNPKIKRLSKNAFVISSKNLSSDICLSPEYYDSLYQAKVIQKMIEKSDNLQTIYNHLEYIVEKGRTRYLPYNYMRFNDEVREFVKQLL